MSRQKRQHLKRRKDGRFCCVYQGRQFMGRTEEEALGKREQYILELRREGAIRENPTVSEYAERWLPVAKAGIRFESYNINIVHLKHLCNTIGDKFVRDVKPLDVKRVYSQEYLNCSGEYISHAKALFVSLFSAAVEDGLLKTNPAASDTAKPHKGIDHSHRAITDEERRLIETIATDHRMHAPAIVMLYAGLRPQEVKALRVDRDVDFDAGVIHVRFSVHKVANNRYEATSEGKTKKAVRDVPLFQPVRDVLQGRTGYLLSDGNDVASKATWASAWQSYRNKMERHMNGCQKRWYGLTCATKAQGDALPPWREFDVVPYDLRHSFATWCRDNGVELHTCVEWMGHADAKMILKIYDEVTDTRSKIEAEKLERMLLNRRGNMQNEKQPTESP